MIPSNLLLTSIPQYVETTNKRTSMRLLFIFTAFILAACVAGAQGAEFITFDNPSLTREERMIKLQVDKHKNKEYASNKQYIFNTEQDVVDRIEMPRKPKGEEKYYGR